MNYGCLRDCFRENGLGREKSAMISLRERGLPSSAPTKVGLLHRPEPTLVSPVASVAFSFRPFFDMSLSTSRETLGEIRSHSISELNRPLASHRSLLRPALHPGSISLHTTVALLSMSPL